MFAPRRRNDSTLIVNPADLLYPEDNQTDDETPEKDEPDQQDAAENDALAANSARRTPMQEKADALYPADSQADAKSDEAEKNKPEEAEQKEDNNDPEENSSDKSQSSQDAWDEIVDVAGAIPKLVRNGKLLYGHNDKKYEELTGIKNGISDLQKKLGLPVTGRFDKQTYSAARNSFVAMILPWAEQAEKEWGVPVQVSVGQALLEASSGLETPTDIDNGIRSHNLYGLKAKEGDDCVTDWTVEQDPKTKKYNRVLDDFKSYDSYVQSVMDHGKFLHEGSATFRKNYRDYDTMAQSNDPKVWAKGLKKAGYATEQDYENRLLNAMGLADKIIRGLKSKNNKE